MRSLGDAISIVALGAASFIFDVAFAQQDQGSSGMEQTALTVSLFTQNVAETLNFYVDQLGFRLTGSWTEGDEPPVWAEVSRDGPKGAARIWFFSNPLQGYHRPAFSGVIYLFVDHVDDEANRLGSNRVDVLWGPEDQAYSLRELGIRDPNGYLICFAEAI